MTGGEATVHAVADAQFSIARILRPYAGFESRYQDRSSLFPVCFFPQGTDGDAEPLDPDAGRTGISPRLIRGTPVPLGARILVWIPMAIATNGEIVALTPYEYQFTWRLRNPNDSAARRMPYHFPIEVPGVPDAGEPRFVIPASTRTVVINQPEPPPPPPPLNTGAERQHLRREYIQLLAGDLPLQPILPDSPAPAMGPPSLGEYQQGVLDATGFGLGDAFRPIFATFWFDAEGDELIIGARRAELEPLATWDFAAADAAFSNIYGTNAGGARHAPFKHVGIYIFTGTAP